jgi:hypothetical protein
VAHCAAWVRLDNLGGVNDGQVLLWCIALIALELQHLKWIVWEHWTCRRCGVKHRECGHGARLVKYF